MADVVQLVHSLVALWNEEDDDARRRQIAAVWADDGVYIDPVVTVTGHRAIEALICTARSYVTGCAVRLITQVDAHHNIARFTLEIGPADRTHTVLIASNLAVAGDDGRLRYVVEFIDRIALPGCAPLG